MQPDGYRALLRSYMPPAAVALTVCLVVAVAAATCTAARGRAGTAAQAAATIASSPIDPTLGHLSVAGGPLSIVIDEPSGLFAQQNRLIMQGAIVALAKLNGAGGIDGRQVRLLPEPLDALSPAQVQARLHAAGPDTVLMLPCDTNSQAILAAGAARYKTLMFAPCDADAALASRLATYWPVGMAGNDEAAGLVQFLHQIGDATAYVLNTEGLSFGTSMTANFRAAAQAAGIRIVGSASTPVGLSATAVKRVASAILAAHPRPGVVFSALPPPYVDELAEGLQRAGVHAYLVGTSAMDTPLTLAGRSSSALQNAVFPSYGFLRQTAQANEWVQAYSKRFGKPVGAFPGLGFETIGLIEDAIAKARSTVPATIEKALDGGIDDAGVALFPRSYERPADHNPVTTVSVEKVYDGAFEGLITTQPVGTADP